MTVPNPKLDIMFWQVTATAAATSLYGYADRAGYDYAVVQAGVRPTTTTLTNNPSVWKLGHSDDTYVTNATDITSLVGDAATGYTIPSNGATSATDDPTLTSMFVDCKGLKRYLHIEITNTNENMTAWAWANLFRAEEIPTTATLAGVGAIASA